MSERLHIMPDMGATLTRMREAARGDDSAIMRLAYLAECMVVVGKVPGPIAREQLPMLLTAILSIGEALAGILRAGDLVSPAQLQQARDDAALIGAYAVSMSTGDGQRIEVPVSPKATGILKDYPGAGG